MFTVSKEVIIHCAHRLPSMPEGHQCRNLHGHTYKVIVTLGANTLDAGGLTVDFGTISEIVKQYDHQFLGSGSVVVDGDTVTSMLGDDVPSTAEVFAAVIGKQVMDLLHTINGDDTPDGHQVMLLSVDVWETPTSHVKWEP